MGSLQNTITLESEIEESYNIDDVERRHKENENIDAVDKRHKNSILLEEYSKKKEREKQRALADSPSKVNALNLTTIENERANKNVLMD